MLGPFASLDGINEKGVSIAVLTLDSLPTRQNSGKLKINTSLAIRLVLDRAASTQEAIDLLGSYDMVAMAGRDYHFFINDASGDSRVVEYDPQKPARPMVVTHAREITNYYACYANGVVPNRKNGAWGMARNARSPLPRCLMVRSLKRRKLPGRRCEILRRSRTQKISPAIRNGPSCMTISTAPPISSCGETGEKCSALSCSFKVGCLVS